MRVHVSSVAKFANQGISVQNSQSTCVFRLVGDATHDQIGQKLKVLRIGVVGCHHASGWCATIIPGVDCVCHDETSEAVDLALQSLAHVLTQHYGLNLADLVLEWFWDGKVEAMQVLSKHFPNALGHLYLEHAKRNAEKRYMGGYKKVMRNFIEMSALLTPYVFNMSFNLFLESLPASG